jgi:hypothetical protein
MHPVTSISILGLHAQRFVERHACARVVAVFSRSLYLESDGDFICIGDPDIGRGPLNAELGHAGWMRLAAAVPPIGTSVRIAQGAFRIGGLALDTTRAELWRPAPWPSAAGRKGVLQALQRAQHVAGEQAPVDGIARTVLGPAGEQHSAFERVARPRVELLRAWVTARPSASAGAPPVDLLGLGPGLTPSGDDVLCGVLVALHAVGETDRAHALYAGIAHAAPAATPPISAAFLRAAAEGLGCEALHAAIAAILEGKSEALAGRIEALGHVGHTSGWDALAGALLVLQAFGTTDGHGAGVARAWISG